MQFLIDDKYMYFRVSYMYFRLTIIATNNATARTIILFLLRLLNPGKDSYNMQDMYSDSDWNVFTNLQWRTMHYTVWNVGHFWYILEDLHH